MKTVNRVLQEGSVFKVFPLHLPARRKIRAAGDLSCSLVLMDIESEIASFMNAEILVRFIEELCPEPALTDVDDPGPASFRLQAFLLQEDLNIFSRKTLTSSIYCG